MHAVTLTPAACRCRTHGCLPARPCPPAVCREFLEQAPASAAIIDGMDAALRAGAMSVAPSAAWADGPLAGGVPRNVACQAGAAALQVSLGGVLPTLLAWQLQSRIAATLVAQAQARQDSAMMHQVGQAPERARCGRCSMLAHVAACAGSGRAAPRAAGSAGRSPAWRLPAGRPAPSARPQVLRSQHAVLCGTVAAATQGALAKLLITLCAMLGTYVAALKLLA